MEALRRLAEEVDGEQPMRLHRFGDSPSKLKCPKLLWLQSSHGRLQLDLCRVQLCRVRLG